MSVATKIQDWAVLPYNSKIIDGHYLVSNFLGNWDFLVPEEFRRLEQLRLEEEDPLFERLYGRGIVVDKKNMAGLIAGYRNLNANLFLDTALHIAVVTTRCNIACKYCHAATDSPVDMSLEVASQVIKYLFDVRSANITLELQGGEPLLNWEVVKYLVENTRKFNTTNKNIHICIVTNGLLLNEEKIGFLLDHGVDICISLDGPEHLHDSNRITHKATGSHKLVSAAIERLKKAYEDRKMDKAINLLPTFTRQTIPYVKDVIDEHLRWGALQIALRSINKIGAAGQHWGDIGCTPEEFNSAWASGMDYILELNKQGVNIKERMALVLLSKILKKQDPRYVDLMNPSGAGRAVLAYDPKGDIYPTDEARMPEDEIFKLGNVLRDEYETIMKSPTLFAVCQSSLIDLWSYNDVYSPWLGTCPVLNYKSQGTLVPMISRTSLHKIQHFQFDYLFRKLLTDKDAKTIFEKWVR